MKKKPGALAAALMLLVALNVAAVRAFSPAAEQRPAQTALPAASAEVAGATVNVTSPASTRAALAAIQPPARNLPLLTQQYKGECGVLPVARVPLYRAEAEGESRDFWVLDEANHRFFQVRATLRLTSEHLLMYVQDGRDVAPSALAASARVFEERGLPLLLRYFADPGEPFRLTVLVVDLPRLGGYFSSSDLYAPSVNEFSNERPIVYMNLAAGLRPGSSAFDSVLVHEAQHFLHATVHPQQDSWVDEGASMLVMWLAGYPQTDNLNAFLRNTETQLNAWSEESGQSYPHYGAGHLMLEYLAQRLGGYHHVKELISSPGSSIATYESYLARSGSGITFDDLFRDFAVANALNDRTVADGRYGYQPGINGRARVQETRTVAAASSTLSNAAVRPYATRYVDLTPAAGARGELELRFGGADAARLYGAPARSGASQWWSVGADDSQVSLTRELDLRDTPRATLRFGAWFDVERSWDYAGVAVSADGGCTWRTLPGKHTTDANPTGQNLGHSFNGRSGGGSTAAWVDEEMDLSAYAGQKVLLRFFYVTDESYHGRGLAVDDISVPEIGFFDDAEQERGWQAEGFLRSVNAAAVDWAVQVITFGDGGTQVQQLRATSAADGAPAEGTLVVPGFGEGVRRVLVAISPLVPVTLEPAEYRLEALLR